MANDPETGAGTVNNKTKKVANKENKQGKSKRNVENEGEDKPTDRDSTDPLLDTNALQTKIRLQEIEISRLTQMLQILAGSEGHNIKEAKILELSKRNRDLNLALEKERECCMKWKYQMNLIKEELLKRKQDEDTAGDAGKGKVEKEMKELQEWKDKYNKANAKLLEVQAARSIVAAEVSKLQHALQREVGDHVPISKVLEEGGDWKGRAQQICLLKDKISKLKCKLKNSCVSQREPNEGDLFEAAQRRDYEQMGIKLLACREDLKITKQKLEAVLARRNILEAELKCAKEKMSMLVGKSDNDDRLITALRLELEAQKQDQGPVLYGKKVGGPLSLDLVQRQHRLAASFQELKRHCYQQELQIQAQAELIDYLRAITSSQHDEEVMKGASDNLMNNVSQFSETSKQSDYSQYDDLSHVSHLT